MADNKSTESPEERTKQEFPEVKGKIVDSVELIADADYYGIDIRFHDKTALAFSFESGVIAVPEYSDWTSGEQKSIKEYKPVQSKIFRPE